MFQAAAAGTALLLIWTAWHYPGLTLALVGSCAVMFWVCAWSATRLLGYRRTRALMLLALGLGWFAEQMGSSRGWFFGRYTYTEVLGPRLGDVPLAIPLMWFALALIGYVMASLMLWRRPVHANPGFRSGLLTAWLAAMVITAFDLGADGSLSGRRVWAEFGPTPTATETAEVIAQLVVAPDGCALDAEGHLWVADAVGGRVVRVAPGGAIVDEVTAPDGLGVYACMLGGEDGRTLLLCAAPDFLEHNRAAVREAVLLTVEVTVPHAGRP